MSEGFYGHTIALNRRLLEQSTQRSGHLESFFKLGYNRHNVFISIQLVLIVISRQGGRMRLRALVCESQYQRV